MTLLRRVAVGALAALAGCTVGPPVEIPEAALPDVFVNAWDDGETIAPGELWRSLDDAALEGLIDAALANNTSIEQAVAALDETRELRDTAFYSLFPTVTVNAEQERNKQSQEDPFSFPGNAVAERSSAGFDAAWEIDLFGSLRQQSRQIRRLTEANAATVHAVRIAVVAEVAQSYFQWRGESHRRELLRKNLDLQADRLGILESSLKAGRGSDLSIAQARANERLLAAALPQADVSVARAEQRLSVLTRLPVATLRSDYASTRNVTDLPAMLTFGEPVDWLRRRPDVYAAEQRLAAETAAVGVDVAEYFPKLNLIGSFGWTGATASTLGDSNAERWRFAPSISWRLFDFGRIQNRVGAAKARLRGARSAYDETWLLALEETENALSNYRAQSESSARLVEAHAAAQEAAKLAELRYDAGAESYLTVLDAQRTRIDVEEQLAIARTSRASALAALYKALGGDFARATVTTTDSSKD